MHRPSPSRTNRSFGLPAALTPLVTLLALAAMVGCEPTYAPRQTIDLRPRILEIENHHGGTRRITLHFGEQWYQSFGPALEVVDADDGLRITQLEHAPWGEIAPITDMVIHEQRELLVCHAGECIVRYDLSNPRRPRMVEEIPAETLGIEPYLLSSEGGEVWVSGRGGATILDSPGFLVLGDLPGDPIVGRVVPSGEGLVAAVGRRILAVDDGRYLGAASDLRSLPPDVAEATGLEGGLAFVLRGSQASTVGILGPDLRERDSKVFPASMFAVRILEDRLWAVMPEELVTWRIAENGRLESPIFIPIKGARDIDRLRENYYAVGGTFGRAIYRLKADGSGDADSFYAVERSPGRITMAVGDGRRVLAGSEEGSWLYRIGGDVELSDRVLRNNAPAVEALTMSWCDASVAEDGRLLRITPLEGEIFEWSPPRRGAVYTIEAAGDYLFVGHDDGLDCFGYRDGGVTCIGSVRLEGPVAWLFRPRVGDDVAFVSAFGGLGTVTVVPDPDADPSLVREVRRDEAAKVEQEMRQEAGMAP